MFATILATGIGSVQGIWRCSAIKIVEQTAQWVWFHLSLMVRRRPRGEAAEPCSGRLRYTSYHTALAAHWTGKRVGKQGEDRGRLAPAQEEQRHDTYSTARGRVGVRRKPRRHGIAGGEGVLHVFDNLPQRRS